MLKKEPDSDEASSEHEVAVQKANKINRKGRGEISQRSQRSH